MLRTALVVLATLATLVSARAAGEAEWRQCLEGRHNLEAMQAACSKILAEPGLSPSDRARALFGRGMALVLRREPKTALKDFDAALVIKAEAADYHLWRGRAAGESGNPDEAIRSFAEAARLSPGWSVAHNNLGAAYARKGDVDRALAEFDLALKSAPDNLLALKNKGEALERKGRKEEAIAAFRRVAAAPLPVEDDGRRAREQAEAHLKRLAPAPPRATADDHRTCEIGNPDARLAACDKVIADGQAVAAERIAAYYSRSGILYDRRQYEAVISDLDQLVALKGDHALALNRRGLAKAELNRNTEAVADYDKALAADPALIRAWMYRGDANRNRGEFERALADYEQALKRDPLALWALRGRGYTYERMGLFAEAEQVYRQVLAGQPRRDNPDDRRARRSAETDLKRIAAALQARSRFANPIGSRAALIIANTRYKGSFEALATPANDASALAAALKHVGFKDADIVVRHDLDRRGMTAALREFEATARTVDWALVYFAGHGVRARSNLDYMIPIDAQVESERDLADEAVALERVAERIADAKKLQMIVFDACRSNDLTRRLYASSDAQRAAPASAAPFEAAGLMIAFSARRGQSAYDGKVHSPFAEALLANLEKPGIDLEAALAATADHVRKATRDAQVPEIYGLGYGKGIVLRSASPAGQR